DSFDSIARYSIPDHSYEAHCLTRKLLCEKRRMYEQKIYPRFPTPSTRTDFKPILADLANDSIKAIARKHGLARSTARALIQRHIGEIWLNQDDCDEIITALGIAIAHEHRVLERLAADEESRGFRDLKESLKERCEQVERFEMLREKLKKPD